MRVKKGKKIEKSDLLYDDFWLNRWALPLILSSILFYFIYFKKTWIDWINKIKNEELRNCLLFILDGLKINLGDWKITILSPAVIAIGLVVLIDNVFNANAGGYGETLWFALITSGFLNPISEEFITRGILLGMFVYAAFKFPKEKNLVYVLGLFVTSVVFVYGHNNSTLFQIVIRFLMSLLFGLLYLINDRNLLPPIMAHAANNIFLILLDVSKGVY